VNRSNEKLIRGEVEEKGEAAKIQNSGKAD
jgi:hypothetical protein